MSAERETSALPASGLAVVIALVLGIVAVKHEPLEKTRPAKAAGSYEQIVDSADVEARLWQDPLDAAHRHHESLKKMPRADHPWWSASGDMHEQRHSIPALRTTIDTAMKGELAILAITVPSARYIEAVESRQRYRYAVLSGLNRAGYAPDTHQNMGYVSTHWADSQEKCPYYQRRLPEVIPFEWFSPSPNLQDAHSPKFSRVLVLWLSEDALSMKPVTSIRALRSCLGLDEGSGSARVTLLATGGSQQLRSIVSDYELPKKRTATQVRIYAPIATASNEAIGMGSERIPDCSGEGNGSRRGGDKRSTYDDHHPNGNANGNGNGNDPSRHIGNANGASPTSASSKHDLCLLRTTATDTALADALVKELELRGIRLNQPCADKGNCKPDRVALVSEWDTFYGRNLPNEMSAAICGHKTCDNVVRASYLQGIDGVIPGDPVDSRGEKTNTNKEAASQTHESAQSERAEGRNQFDYLRRLAADLKRRSTEDGKGKIKAIGVLGNDVYDKLLVLQALRPQFPEAQFFTTDLDARLLERQEFPHTRNVIVASSFDLRLRESLQGDIPPFRSTYQTALFLSTLLALEPDLPVEALRGILKPRLFELGRHTAFALPEADAAGASPACNASHLFGCKDVHPALAPLVRARFGFGYYVAVLLLVGAAAAPLYSAYRLRPAPKSLNGRKPSLKGDPDKKVSGRIPLHTARGIMQRRKGNTVLTAVFAFAALILLMHAVAIGILGSTPNHEPLDLLEGISLWPTEALRLLTGLLAIFLTYWAALRMDANSIELSTWFFAHTEAQGVPDFDFNGKSILRGIRDHLTSWKKLRKVFACNLFAHQPRRESNQPIAGAPLDAGQFWYRCAYHSSPAVSLIRTFVATAFFYVAGFALMMGLGFPQTPYRGELSWYVDRFAVLFWSTPLVLFLTFYVADATLLCKRFISALTECRMNWPEETRKHFGVASRAEPNGQRRQAGSYRDDPAVVSADRDEAADAWIDVQLIARRTAAVGPLIYYPTIAMLLLMFARSSLFDGWHWPPGLIWVLAASTAVLVLCYVVLRREAESARAAARSIVSRRLVAAKSEGDGPRGDQLDQMLKQIENMREGSFGPITHQPLVKALLIFLSASGLAVLEHFGVISF